MGNKNAKNSAIKTELSDEEFELILANTHYNRFEIIEWFEEFIKDCPNGNLGKKEFENAYKKLNLDGNNLSTKLTIDRVFNVFDAKKSGFIGFKDFLLALSALTDEDLSKRLYLVFKIIATDLNHKITAKELTEIIQVLYELRDIQETKNSQHSVPNQVKKIFKNVNKNEDESLTENEFVDGFFKDRYILQKLNQPTSILAEVN